MRAAAAPNAGCHYYGSEARCCLHKGNSQIRGISGNIARQHKAPLTPTTTHHPPLLYTRRSSTGGVVPNIYPTFSSLQLCVPGLNRCMCQWHPVTYSGLQSMATQGNSKTCSSTQPVRPSPLPSGFWGSTQPVYTGLEIND